MPSSAALKSVLPPGINRHVASKQSPLERLLGRLDQLDKVNLNILVQRLARERGLLETVLNTIQEGVLVIRDSGEIEYGNASAARLLGMGSSELTGEELWHLVPGLRPTLEPSLHGAAPPEVVSREFEVNYPQRRFLRLHLMPFGVPGGDPASFRRFIVIVSDVTQQKLSTEELIETERISSLILLAGGVAHELGNPLNSLTIHLQLMARKIAKLKNGKDADSLRESVAVCQQEVERLDGIITHFLEAIRPRPPDFSDVKLDEVLEEVLRVQGRELADRGVRTDIEFASEMPLVLGDANQLKQVFFNLIKNAIEAMKPGGVLRIRSRVDDDNLYLLVGDTGSGIRKEDMPRMFEPYHTTKQGGHGLGLMIVHRILRDHGGQVGIDSKEGLGTVVTLQFPLKHRRVRMLHH
jgi:two-component system, sporulation sensor kinase E